MRESIHPDVLLGYLSREVSKLRERAVSQGITLLSMCQTHGSDVEYALRVKVAAAIDFHNEAPGSGDAKAHLRVQIHRNDRHWWEAQARYGSAYAVVPFQEASDRDKAKEERVALINKHLDVETHRVAIHAVRADGWTSLLTGIGPMPIPTLDKATGAQLDEYARMVGIERHAGTVAAPVEQVAMISFDPGYPDKMTVVEVIPTVGGRTLGELVITLCDAQREVPHQMEKWRTFTSAQKNAARAEWSRQVARDVKASADEDARREREQVVVDEDRWDV